ncbi:MAG TPA: sel1 repeat family protein, partial [Gammaproteobacteria bacterium]|nr:sel1 repeat family protein [Gammaproteobacteria bacterium]
AHMWFNIAASTGHALAQKYRDTLASRMGKAALAEAQRKARSCVAKVLKDC